MKKKRGWRGRVWKAVADQGERRREAGELFLDRNWQKKARAARPLEGWCLTEAGIEVSLPQGAAAPSAEGCPVFLVEREEQ